MLSYLAIESSKIWICNDDAKIDRFSLKRGYTSTEYGYSASMVYISDVFYGVSSSLLKLQGKEVYDVLP